MHPKNLPHFTYFCISYNYINTYDIHLNFLFRSFINGKLIFNTNWEDPAVDRELLDINSDSMLFTICSAGDNALDYLLDDPALITAVDINPAQTALLELKMSVFKKLDHDALFEMFGSGIIKYFKQLYHKYLRDELSGKSKSFWDRKTHYFKPSSSFYYRGMSGLIAKGFHTHYKSSKKLRLLVDELLNSNSLEEQSEIYSEIDKRLFDTFAARKLLNNNYIMSFLGIPDEQIDLLEKYGEYESIYEFIRQSLRRVFATIPVNENYFWYVYINGKYEKNNCPEYLNEENFQFIKDRIKRIELENISFYEGLKERKSESISHFILLDHFDWFWQDRSKQLELWNEIKRTAKSEAKVLFRTAAADRSFLPAEVLNDIEFDDERCNALHQKDRVGTYGSLHFGELK